MSAPMGWYSKSRKGLVPLSEMHTAHLIAAYRKWQKGEAQDAQGEPLSASESALLGEAFAAEFVSRNVVLDEPGLTNEA